MGAVFALTRFSLVRISIRDLVADRNPNSKSTQEVVKRKAANHSRHCDTGAAVEQGAPIKEHLMSWNNRKGGTAQGGVLQKCVRGRASGATVRSGYVFPQGLVNFTFPICQTSRSATVSRARLAIQKCGGWGGIAIQVRGASRSEAQGCFGSVE